MPGLLALLLLAGAAAQTPPPTRPSLQKNDSSAGVKAEPLFNFNTMSSSQLRRWILTQDSVMGGHSQGHFQKMDHNKCHGALMSGVVELKHGGFVNVRSPLGAIPGGALAHADGIRVCSKATVDYGLKDGSGDLYKINLRDRTRNTHTADFHTSEVGAKDFDQDDDCDGVISTLHFSAFWPTHWGRQTGRQGSINPAQIQQVGFDIAFVTANSGQNKELDHKACVDHDSSTVCKNENPFGLCVQWVQYYKDANHQYHQNIEPESSPWYTYSSAPILVAAAVVVVALLVGAAAATLHRRRRRRRIGALGPSCKDANGTSGDARSDVSSDVKKLRGVENTVENPAAGGRGLLPLNRPLIRT